MQYEIDCLTGQQRERLQFTGRFQGLGERWAWPERVF
jgi:hypothetical protein